MKKFEVVQAILSSASRGSFSSKEKGRAFAPTNIALVKYWGKRDKALNLPVTSSLSVALPDKGASVQLTLLDSAHDVIRLNGNELSRHAAFAFRISQFLDLFRPQKEWSLQIEIEMSIPVAAGLASSACGFASLVAALDDLFNWQLTKRELSILARLGSGSAARSLWPGFVEWHAGRQGNGMDSFAEPLARDWPSLCLGLLILDGKEKGISSREAMQRTVESSLLYENWPKKVAEDLVTIKQAIDAKDFPLLGGTAESNALTMHATMLSSSPPICYFLPETISSMHKVWALRREGMEIYFTQDAGPNLKLLFLEKDKASVKAHFPSVEVSPVF